jgi:hypothetical protein
MLARRADEGCDIHATTAFFALLPDEIERAVIVAGRRGDSG